MIGAQKTVGRDVDTIVSNTPTLRSSARRQTTAVGRLAPLIATLWVAAILAWLPGRTLIPPLVGSDYCYLLTAADRLYEGLGPTATLPVAPGQPWTWQGDWHLLTRWPIGYPLLVCGVRAVLGVTSIEACRALSVGACAIALVGWFVWIRRTVPRGVTGLLLAAVGAGCSVSAASLLNPSTDLLLVAILPLILLTAAQAVEPSLALPADDRSPCIRSPKNSTTDNPPPTVEATPSATRSAIPLHTPRAITVRLMAAGFLAGGLFWIRYASVFVPAAVALYLFAVCPRRRIHLRAVAVFLSCAALPIVILLAINRTYGPATAFQEQLNLGHTVKFDLSMSDVATAWWRFTDFGFYDYHWYSHWLFALWPVALLVAALFARPVRRALRSFFSAPGVALGAFVVFVLLSMLVGVTALFGDKYDFVGLDRYYTPARPLYFVMFVAPLLLIRRRAVRILLAAGLLVCCSWIVRQEWPRPYKRWLTADREVTPYGAWGRSFSPGAADLYQWLGNQRSNDLVVVSNFHDFITLETQIPAIPVPPDEPTLRTWIDRIRTARGVGELRVLFVLDPDRRWRDYYLRPPFQIVSAFDLHRCPDTPRFRSAMVYRYTGPERTDRTLAAADRRSTVADRAGGRDGGRR